MKNITIEIWYKWIIYNKHKCENLASKEINNKYLMNIQTSNQ